MAVSRGQKVKGQGHTVTKTVTVAWLLVAAVAVVLQRPPWDCTAHRMTAPDLQTVL